MTTAAEIQRYCTDNKADVSFDKSGMIRVMHAGTRLEHVPTLEGLAHMIGVPFADGFAVTLDADGYYSLADVLKRAFDQASGGKGKERHANALPFDRQPMQTIADQVGIGFLLGQAIKKVQESQSLPAGRDVAELLGAINYLAGAVIKLERERKAAVNDNQTVKGATFVTSMGRVGPKHG